MQFENNTKEGVILLREESKEIGRLNYTLVHAEQKLIISYVLVHTEFKGTGMGKVLVEEAVRYAKQNQWSVEPHCSFARVILQRMEKK